MGATQRIRSTAKWLAAGAGVAAASYAAYVGVTWYRYGQPRRRSEDEQPDLLLDRFMPTYEVCERHHARVAASPETTFAAACEMDLSRSPIARGLFRSRELIMGGERDETVLPAGLLAMAKSLGWSVLAETPGREVVVGAITQPWQPNVTFQSLPPDEFAGFAEPGWVKIAWTLRADPAGQQETSFTTETRATTTDPTSRAAFRRYWSFFSPGIVLIRRLSLRLLKEEAERRAGRARPASTEPRVTFQLPTTNSQA